MRAYYEALADGRTLIRYDKPGCGLSERVSAGTTPLEPYSVEHELDALQAVVTATGVGRFDLMGASVGAPVAATWAARWPATVSRLVLYGGLGLRTGRRRAGRPAARTRFGATALGAGRRPARRSLRTGRRRRHPGGVHPVPAGLASAETACAMLEMAYRLDVRGLLPQVRAPTLVVHRSRDRAAPIDQGRLLAEGIPNARFEAIVGRSHLPYIGDAQQLTRVIRRFLGLPERHRGAAPTLTVRRREVAALIAEGCTNREIGERLGIAERSAEAHVERIRCRMDFRSRSQIAAWYVATGGPN